MHKKILALLCLTFSIVLLGITISAAETADTNVIYVSGTAAEGGMFRPQINKRTRSLLQRVRFIYY